MYAQKNYLEKQGVNGKYRISQVGSLLVAFSNLLKELFDEEVGSDPLSLNKMFAERGVYTAGDEGVQDQLSLDAVEAYDPGITHGDVQLGTPENEYTIAMFTWLGSDGKPVNHYSLVHDAEKHLIVDSFDGKVKSWDVYGGPVKYIEYGVAQ